jgi:flagellar biogenesis protein FliO
MKRIRPLAASSIHCLLPVVVVALALCSAHSAASAVETPSDATPTSTGSLAIKPHNAANRDDLPPKPGGFSPATLIGSLALVIGLFLAVLWLLRRASPHGGRVLPTEAFESLGRAPLAHRHLAHLLRFGNKLLLVSTNAENVEVLAEITDPAEVERLTELCRRPRSDAGRAAVAPAKGSAKGEA